MTIEVINVFKVPLGSKDQIKTLDAGHLTALAIWLVEGINNPDVLPLHFKETPFIWRINPEKGDDHFKVTGFDLPVDMLQARELVDDIEALANQDKLLDDTYPGWNDYPWENSRLLRYVVQEVDGILGYVDAYQDNKPILPIGLKVTRDYASYYTVVVANKITNTPYYKFEK